MADILIRGVEMPESTIKKIIVYPNGDIKFWNCTDATITVLHGAAVELPPHGDLVDATQYRDEFMDGVYNMCADDPDNNRANVIIDLYDCAPVVVPAERSGE